MASLLLTDLAIKSMKVNGPRQVDFYDSKVRGLAVRVSPGGTKSFVVWYRVGTRARRLTLGRYPIIQLAEARKRAQLALSEVTQGRDPAIEKARVRREYDTTLFSAVVDDFIEMHAKRHTTSWAGTERMLRQEFVRHWRTRPVQTITQRDVRTVLEGIVARGSPSSANHAFSAVRKMFNWAVEQHFLPASPCAGISTPTQHRSRDYVLTRGDLRRVWEGAEAMGYPYGRILQLLMLTGQRRKEVSGMRWQELDLSRCLWSIPATRTKNGRTHVVPLSAAALAIIEKVPQADPALLFPAKGKSHGVSGFSKWKREIDHRTSLRGWVVHDLRRTVASGMAELKVPPHIIERVLNHTTGILGGVAGIYNRFGYIDEMREALESWAVDIGR